MIGFKTKGVSGISIDRLIQPTLLLLIYIKPSHGYELIQNFHSFDPTQAVEPGTIYRNLRRMEGEGLITSTWETTGPGPARRKYEITRKGADILKELVPVLEHQKKQIEEFLCLYKNVQEGEGK